MENLPLYLRVPASPKFQVSHERHELELGHILHDVEPQISQIKEGYTPLLLSVGKGDIENTRILLDKGALVNYSTENNSISPLILSILNKSTEMTKYLLERGADPNNETAEGMRPLIAAIEAGKGAAVDYLVSSGADVFYQPMSGYGTLEYAVAKGNTEILQAFRRNGIHIQERRGKSKHVRKHKPRKLYSVVDRSEPFPTVMIGEPTQYQNMLPLASSKAKGTTQLESGNN